MKNEKKYIYKRISKWRENNGLVLWVINIFQIVVVENMINNNRILIISIKKIRLYE